MPAPHTEEFDCFGGRCSVTVVGVGANGAPRDAARWARAQLLGWHAQFSRFLPQSELSRLNTDPRTAVPASPLMLELAAAVRAAGAVSGGLVDGTLVGALEASGYADDRPHLAPPATGPATDGLDWGAAPARPAGASDAAGWSTISVDRAAGLVLRPPGVRLDSGGLVKGLLADVLAAWLGDHDDVVVDCCGDVRFGGAQAGSRELEIGHPLGGVAAALEVDDGAVATSGVTGRRWRNADGTPGHHLIDPSTGRPARTGLSQVTALAPTALEAEVLAKWALLSGPEQAGARLRHGGVLVDEAGAVQHVISAPRDRVRSAR